MHLKKVLDVLGRKISETEFLLLFEQIAFLGSFDEFKMYQLCQFITIRMQSTCYQKAAKCPGSGTNICDLG